MKNKKTNPVRFCEDLKGELDELDIIPFESIIDKVKEGSSYRHPGSVSLKEELEWYLYSGVRSNLLIGTIFLNSRSTYLNFCFPETPVSASSGRSPKSNSGNQPFNITKQGNEGKTS